MGAQCGTSSKSSAPPSGDKHGQAWDQADEEGMAFIQGLNRDIYTLSSEEQQRWKAAVEPILDDYVEQAKSKGLAGDEFLTRLQTLIAEAQLEN